MNKTYRLEDDLMKKSIPKQFSKRWNRLRGALESTRAIKCERCGRFLFNPQSILIHQGKFCKQTFNNQ